MRRFSTTLAIAISTLLFVSICSAQQTAATSVPNLIRYSGTLKDVQGAAPSSSTAVGVTFSIYKQQDGGASVWMETQNVTPDANGQYNVILGSTTATGLPDDLFSQQEQRWLGVQVQGEAEQARVLLVSVPYAFKAHEADTLGGLPASAFVKAPPSDASGSTSTDAGTAVNALGVGTASNGKDAAGSAKAPCPAGNNYILFWQPPGFDICPSVIWQSTTAPTNGYIGIKQTNPSTQLDVLGAINASPDSVLNSDTGNYQILEKAILSIGWPSQLAVVAKQNTYVGVLAGAQGFLQGPGTGDTGTSNTFVGYNAAFHNQTGSQNTAVGVGAGYRNTTGSSNTYVGLDAGWTNGGNINNNTFVGWESGFNNAGSNNVYYGYSSGLSNAAGSNNVYLNHLGANENNTIRLGMNGAGPFQQKYAFFEPILSNNSTFVNTSIPVVTIATTGQLGYQLISSGGGGNVNGNCPLGGGYITLWSSATTVTCSAMFQLGNNIGIGNTNPSKALDVTGEINTRTWYDIGLPETPVLSIGPTVTFADGNLFVGAQAGNNTNILGGADTFVGYQAGFHATGTDNTFSGYQAGFNATGRVNTFSGSGAGYGATTGFNNTGIANTMSGYQAGYFNTTGSYNTFSGYLAGYLSTTGQGNTFFGFDAGIDTSTTSENTCVGDLACHQNIGSSNVCVGSESCYANQSGSYNTQIGTAAGQNFHGNYDIYAGYQAGFYNNLGDGNIDIGSQGCANNGCGGPESNIIRIGNYLDNSYTKQTQVFIETILANHNPSNSAEVVINTTTGQLGYMGSSLRFKEQIADMGDSSSKLFQLRPVTFFYKPEYSRETRTRQYGLIAEEVAKVYPDLVAYDKDGQPLTVKYQLLAPMLLSELQKQHTIVMAQQDELQTQLQQIKAQRHEIDGLKLQLQQQNASLQERLTRLESYVATQMKTASDNPPRTIPGANGGLQ